MCQLRQQGTLRCSLAVSISLCASEEESLNANDVRGRFMQ